jgi:lipopolysaccharide transport system ATP-binding protein
MSKPIISVENLSKRYLVGHQSAQRERYTALRDVIAREARNFARKTVDLVRGKQIVQGDEIEEFWALKNVSFEVRQGEVVGIIGRNGAGKSTLLKVLSRITEPTEGRILLRGRVASLLEVGTGFHPELTGRENIFLNGAILGMTRSEIRRKFDEIVAFAEVERFLDTPVKRYSSGMYVRLAFAVAAHLEPEILVVDEVLAVGDVEFQKKCLGKISEVADGGRTVLFVSHNLSAISRLCPRSILLMSGTIVDDAKTSEVVDTYLRRRRSTERDASVSSTKVQEGLLLERMCLAVSPIRSGGPAEFKIVFRADVEGQIRECAVLIYSANGVRVAIIDIREFGAAPFRYSVGCFQIAVRIPAIPFIEGEFTTGLYLVTDGFAGNLFDLDEFTVFEPRDRMDFAPYPAETRGLVALNGSASVAFDLVEAV